MPAAPRAQIGLEDNWVEDPEFETLLEERQVAKDALSVAAKEYRALDEKAKAKVSTLNLQDDEERRCGRFVLSSPIRGGGDEVSFTPEVKARPTIKLAKAKE